MKDHILIALEEAAIEVRFRLEDVAARREEPHPMVRDSVKATLDKIREAIKTRKAEASPDAD